MIYSVDGTRLGALAQELLDAAGAPLSRLGRTSLVFAAYMLGAAALVASSIITQSATGSVVTQLTSSGSSEVTISQAELSLAQPWRKDDPTAKQSWQYAEGQSAALRGMEGVRSVAQVRNFNVQGNHLTRLSSAMDPMETSRVQVRSSMTTVDELHRWGLIPERGRIDLMSSEDHQVVALGAEAAQKFGISDVAPGLELWINGRPVSVVAVFSPTGQTEDDQIYLSPGCLPVLRDQLRLVHVVETEPGYAEPIARAAPMVLAPDNPGSISVSTVAQLAKLQEGINSDLGSLMSAIGIVVLVLSGLTASTTMFLAVNNRYPEIALRRAMGASRSSIARLFLYEGTAIGLAGSVVGTSLGVAVGWLAARSHHWELSVGWQTIILGWGAGLLTGVLASIIPAAHAARKDPAGILRSA